MRLKDKVAIITGGGTGIGKGIATLFSQEGASIVICGRRKEPLEKTVKEIKMLGGEAIYCVCDVSNQSQIQEMIETTILKFGQIDILVNNAGVYRPSSVLSITEEEWDTVMNIDAKGVAFASKAVIPYFIKQESGKIVNIASIAGLLGFEKSAAYCSAKGAVINLTRQMAIDLTPRGIQVNAIAPGIIESEMTQSSLTSKEMKKAYLEKIPAGRIGTAEDIAYATVFLSSDESSYITGQTLIVDGGWTIQ